MPQSVPKGLTREHVLWAISQMDAEGERKPGTQTDYVLVHNGQSYPPKTVISLACRGLIGRVLELDEFSGGEAPGQACFVLHELGFAVEKSGKK